MRMWMVKPELMCNKHLLGEHVEIHMFIGSIKKGISMKGYVDKDLIEPMALLSRHTELVHEMEERGMNHKSPLDDVEVSNIVASLPLEYQKHQINEELARALLFDRCGECRERMMNEEYGDM